MPDNNAIDQAPPPEEEISAGAKQVLSGGAAPSMLAGGSGQGAPPAPPANPEHARVGQIFHSVLGTLSGGQREPKMDASGQITEAPVDRTGGEWARRLLAGALTGMASGAKAGTKPGAGPLAGIGEGFEGEQESLANQDRTKREQLQKNFQNDQGKKQQDQEGLLRQAQIAHLTTQNAAAGFALSREQTEAAKESVDAYNTFQKLVGADPANTDLGVFPDMSAVLAYRRDHPEIIQQMAGNHSSGQIAAVPSFDDKGVFNGVHAVVVHPSLMDKPLSELFPDGDAPVFQYRVPGKMVNGKPGPDEWKQAAFAPGTKFGDALTMNQKAANDAAKATYDAAQTAKTEAETEKNKVETEKLRREGAEGGGAQSVDEIGRPLPALDANPEKSNKMRETRRAVFDKEYNIDLGKFDRMGSQLDHIIANAKTSGKLPGPDSLVGIMSAVGVTASSFKGMGLRVNKDFINQHENTRNVWEGMNVGFEKVKPSGTGQTVTLGQLEGYQRVIQDAKHDMYVMAAQKAEEQGLPKYFLPKGGGAPIDRATMKIFHDSYGGDSNAAAQAASKFGWSVPK